jgi:retron-type reverse transcriptase
VNRGANWIVELDIETFYDRIDHDLLMRFVEKRICDRRMLKLLWQWLKAGWSTCPFTTVHGGLLGCAFELVHRFCSQQC